MCLGIPIILCTIDQIQEVLASSNFLGFVKLHVMKNHVITAGHWKGIIKGSHLFFSLRQDFTVLFLYDSKTIALS